MTNKYAEYKNLNLVELSNNVLKYWEENNIFRQSLAIREGKIPFIFYEGPPSANGKPGIHHVMARAIKDIFCRYKTQKGFYVERKAGWDTHGLPIELAVEQSLGITKEDIGTKISVDEYNQACRKEVMKYKNLWDDLTVKMGYWVDLENPYITFENEYIETLWYLLAQMYKKGLLYKGYTIQPYSPAAGTGLSSHELNMPGCYRDVKDTTVVAQFRLSKQQNYLKTCPWGLSGEMPDNVYVLAWTTTPWTLPSNTALAIGPTIDYVLVRTFNAYSGNPIMVILAKALLPAYFSEKNENLSFDDYRLGDKNIPYQVVAECKGEKLLGLEYEQLIPWVNPGKGAFRLIAGDYVTTEDGTGIVHIAPTFGADDDRVAKQANVPPLFMIDRDGKRQPMVDKTGKFYRIEDLHSDFVKNQVNVALYKDFAGRYVKNEYDAEAKEDNLDIDICVMLKQQNLAFKIEKHTHNYPHCWRTDKPILYYPLDSWFIRTTAVKERMIALNKTIRWKPESTGSGRFGNWLENLVDWNLSRTRYWGTPLPIWRTEDGSEEICIESVAQLRQEIDKAVAAGFMKENPYQSEDYNKFDLHRPYIDHVVLVSPSGKKMMRELDLIDVWFDSGAMPYAQYFYPRNDISKVFPADFIAEGVDQTRGWFFTLH
ncbi:MAG TPA: isoleucine--tRNA ligase, partial [Bacteroidales bacterium]|nr:isoleucine--tRNA ligase [Bacteroidales bacterium]